MNKRTIAEPSKRGRPPTNQLAVFDYLVRTGVPKTLNDLAAALGFKHFLAREAVENLVNRGVVAGFVSDVRTNEKSYIPVDAFRPEWEGVSVEEMEKIRDNVQFAVDRATADVWAASKRRKEALVWLRRVVANIEVRKLATEEVRNVGT